MDCAESKLVEELKAGKAEAFDHLLDAHGARLYSFASRMCKNTEDARDIVQETLMAVFRSLKEFRGESRFQTWVFKIAANACWKMKRKGKFEPDQELSLDDFMPMAHGDAHTLEIPDWSQNPEALLLRAEMRATVETAIAELPSKYRVVLALRDIEQFSTDETAEILGLSPEAVKSRLHRARLYLRERLTEYLHPGTPASKRKA